MFFIVTLVIVTEMESSIFVFHREIVQKRDTNINGGIQAILFGIKKNYRGQRCIKICRCISLQQGEQQRPQMVQLMLGDFHINFQLPPSHIPQSQFQQEIVKKSSNNSALHRLSCLNHRGRSVCPSGVYWQSSNLSRSFGTSPISLTLSLYTKCNAHSFVICKGIGSKQNTPLMRPFQGNHVRTYECVNHGRNEAGPGWDGTSTGEQRRD